MAIFRKYLVIATAGAIVLAGAPAIGAPQQREKVPAISPRPVRSLATLPAAPAPDPRWTPPKAKAADPASSEVLEAITWISSCGSKNTTQSGKGAVPRTLDVCGSSAPDLLVRFTVQSGGGVMRVTRLPSAPTAMPLKLEVVFRDPRTGTTSQVALGYDAAASSAPAQFTATLKLTATVIDIAMTSSAATSMALLGEIFQPGTGGARIRPQRMRLGYAPVPATAGINLNGNDGTFTATAATATIADLDFEDRSQTTGHRQLDARIDRLPSSLTLSLGSAAIRLRSSAAIGSVDGELRDFDSAGSVTRHIGLELSAAPTMVDILHPEPSRATVSGSASIGSMFAGFARNRSIAELGDAAYLHTHKLGAQESMALRAADVRSASLAGGMLLSATTEMRAGPFHLLLIDNDRRLDATARDLPTTSALSIDPPSGLATFEGSAGVAELIADAVDPAGLTGRATRLNLRIVDLPATTTVDFAQNGDAFGIGTASGVLGLIELSLDDDEGTPAILPSNVDGLILRDTTTSYQVAARITGLRSVSVRQRPTIELLLDTTSGNAFHVDLQQQSSTLLTKISNLSPHTTLRFQEDSTTGPTLRYAAAQATNRIELEATGLLFPGRIEQAQLDLSGVPAAVTLSFGPETGPGVDIDTDATLGSVFAHLTSGPTESLTGSGVKLIDTSAQFTLVLRVNGVRHIAARQRPYLEVETQTATQPFTVSLRQADQAFDTSILDLPSEMTFRLSQDSSGQLGISHTANAPVGQIRIDATNLPSNGRAKRAQLVLTGLPTSFDINLGAEDGGIDFDTNGANIGMVEVLLTSGPTAVVPSGMDGVNLTDTPTAYTLAARISGLRRVNVRQDPVDLYLDATGNRMFDVRLDTQSAATAKHTFTSARISTLQRNTRIRLTDDGPMRLVYSADSPTSSLIFNTNSGERTSLVSTIVPLPTSVEICAVMASNACGNTALPANKFSLRATASSAATINLADCRVPGCAEELSLTNLRVRKLETNVHLTQSCAGVCLPEGSAGRIWLDTDSLELVGELSAQSPDIGVTARFPTGFDAQNRQVDYTVFSNSSTGSIDCQGLDYEVELKQIGITVDIASELC